MTIKTLKEARSAPDVVKPAVEKYVALNKVVSILESKSAPASSGGGNLADDQLLGRDTKVRDGACLTMLLMKTTLKPRLAKQPTSKKTETSTNSNEKEARNRIIEKKPPMAAISLGTDVDAPRGYYSNALFPTTFLPTN